MLRRFVVATFIATLALSLALVGAWLSHDYVVDDSSDD
jgi:hypothetical protein